MVGLCIWLFFGVAYIWLGFSQSIVEAFMISFDVSIVAGYTKHAFREIDFWQQVLLAFNLALGVLWYAILIPTLVNRVSRAR